jgi:hypothetical protein
MLSSPYMQNITISSSSHFDILYRANASKSPPTIARPPVAMFETAALVLCAGGAVDVELTVADVLVPVEVVLLRVESVAFELELGLRVVVFALEVETTVTVEEGIDEVEVLV